MVQRLLEKHGCRVVSAGDGYDALMAVSNQRFDLIVSDIDMPNLDGLKLLDIINQKNILTPVMFLTGSSDEQVEVKALEMGAVEFVQKPFKPEALWARIKKLLSAKSSNNN